VQDEQASLHLQSSLWWLHKTSGHNSNLIKAAPGGTDGTSARLNAWEDFREARCYLNSSWRRHKFYSRVCPAAFLSAHLFFNASESALLQAALLFFLDCGVGCAPAVAVFLAIVLATPARLLTRPWGLSLLVFLLPFSGLPDGSAPATSGAPSSWLSSLWRVSILSLRSAAFLSCFGDILVTSMIRQCGWRMEDVKSRKPNQMTHMRPACWRVLFA